MDELGKPKKTRGRRSATSPGNGLCGTANVIGISLQIQGEEFEIKFDMPDSVSDKQKIENAEKMGHFIGILQQGKLASLLTYSAAKWGIVGRRDDEAQIMIGAMHVSMNLNMIDGKIVDPPLVSPMDAFVMRKE
jgi:hypothetical protein